MYTWKSLENSTSSEIFIPELVVICIDAPVIIFPQCPPLSYVGQNCVANLCILFWIFGTDIGISTLVLVSGFPLNGWASSTDWLQFHHLVLLCNVCWGRSLGEINSSNWDKEVFLWELLPNFLFPALLWILSRKKLASFFPWFLDLITRHSCGWHTLQVAHIVLSHSKV